MPFGGAEGGGTKATSRWQATSEKASATQKIKQQTNRNERTTISTIAKVGGTNRTYLAQTAKMDDATLMEVASGKKKLKDTTAHVANNSGENEWYTPPQFIEAATDCWGPLASVLIGNLGNHAESVSARFPTIFGKLPKLGIQHGGRRGCVGIRSRTQSKELR